MSPKIMTQEHFYAPYVFTVGLQSNVGVIVDFEDLPYRRGRSYRPTSRFCIKITAKDAGQLLKSFCVKIEA